MNSFTDRAKRQIINLAKEYQQIYYELLPDWFEYDFENYYNIKHRIGYALFGLPKIDEIAQSLSIFENRELLANPDDAFNKVIYDNKMCKVIDDIYEKIIKFGRHNANGTIHVGIIFNTFAQKPLQEISKTNNESNIIISIPIFKIKIRTSGILYIDHEGRIYETWKNYITNNTLQQCIMILPAFGLYQCDPNCAVTQYNSTVWIEIVDSPDCNTRNTFLRNVDIATSTMAVCSLGISTASIFSPIGPAVLAAGLVFNGINVMWTVARNSQKLVDRIKHNQSVNPTNGAAFPAWLDIAGSVFTLGASGGTMVMSKAIARSSTIGTAAKLAYRSLLVGNVTVCSINTALKSYNLMNKCEMKSEVNFSDTVRFASNVLFFRNAVISTKLASEFIESSEGTIFEKFKTILSSARLMEEFNKMNPNSSSNKPTDSRGIICKINEITDAEHFFSSLNKTTSQMQLIMDKNNIVIRNKIFLDPFQFVGRLLTAGTVIYRLIDSRASGERNDIMIKLKVSLKQLLKEFFGTKYSNEQLPDIRYFNDILHEMKYTNSPVNILIKCFKIATLILAHCNKPEKLVLDSIYFLWIYCKANLKIFDGNNVSAHKNKMFDVLTNILDFLYESIDIIVNELFLAFMYMLNKQFKVY